MTDEGPPPDTESDAGVEMSREGKSDRIDPISGVKLSEYDEDEPRGLSGHFPTSWQQGTRGRFADQPRWARRTIVAVAILLDSTILGLKSGLGSLNLLDWLLGDSLPNEMLWLVQVVLSFVGGFALLRVIFDDMSSSKTRTTLLFLSPVLLFALTMLTLEMLFLGQDKGASITFDLAAIGTNTLIWSATYLSIAIGLTLTYKVQSYGNFAQAELFMVGMYVGMILAWSDAYFPLYETPGDGVITWTILLRSLLIAFVLTGFVGILLDRGIYRGFRIRKASPQVMMIASLGVALILRGIYFMRFGPSKIMFRPDSDFQHISNKWVIPTTKFRFNIGERSLGEGETYSQFNCEQTGVDESGEPILSRIVSDSSKPKIEVYDVATDCATALSNNFPVYKGALPLTVFLSVAMLVILLNKSRLGMRMRAVADNPELAASSGINVESIQLVSAFLSAGVTGAGGAVFATTLLFNPTSAFSLLLPSFAVIVLGTIGSIPGAIVASFLVGVVRAASSPVLVGVGYPLGRSGYSAMGGVMPYIFLVAILMVMPQGIGDAWEKWKIERTRKRNQEKNQRGRASNSDKLLASLAILPTGILGLHHWKNGRSDKAQNYSILTFGAYITHRISGFIGRNSFADEACSELCTNTENAETNIALLTGRNDGTVTIQDSPFFSESATTLDEKWLRLMETEIHFANFATELSEIIWPLVPLLLWMFAIFEGIDMLNGGSISARMRGLISGLGTSESTRDSSRGENKRKTGLSLIVSPIFNLNRIHHNLVNQSKGAIISNSRMLWEKASSWTAIQRQHASTTIKDRFPDFHNRASSTNILANFTDPYGREGSKGSWFAFSIFFAIMLSVLWWLPISTDPDTFYWDKSFQLSNVIQSISIFVLMAFSLNLHTGYTGMVNFGVIFFVGVSAITVCVLTAPKEMNGYGWDILPAALVAITLSACFGWSLAYPTARLRTDYFAIVTISLGEIVKLLLSAEPILRTGPTKSAIGLGSYPLPLKDWWFCGSGVETGPNMEFASANDCRSSTYSLSSPSERVSEILSLGEPAPYSFFLAIVCLISVIVVWILLQRLLSSPWGRILKAIREDEEVAQHHGHDVLRNKAASLALGAAIAGLAGVLWAWKLTGISPAFMSPASTTFLVWAAFIIGGSANNKGMIIGAMIIVMMEYVFNVLVVASSPDLPLYETANEIDRVFVWFVTEQWEVTAAFASIAFIGILFRGSRISEFGFWGALVFAFTALLMQGERSLASATNYAGEVTISGAGMAYIKLVLIGSLMLFSLKYNPKGMLPEVPMRPERPNRGDVQ